MKKPLPQKDMRDLYKATNHVRYTLVLIWLTMITYIMYVEFGWALTLGTI